MNLAPLFQTLGQAGSQYADARLQLPFYRLKLLADKLKAQQGEVDLADMQERLRRLKLQPDTEEGALIEKINALKKTASSMNIKLAESDIRQALGLPAYSAESPNITKDIEQGLSALPENQRKVVEPAVRAYLDAGQPEKAMQVYSSVAEKFQAEPKTAEPLKAEGGATYGFKIGGKILTPGSPDWTPELQNSLDAAVRADLAAEKRKEELETRRENAAMARFLRGLKLHEQSQLFSQFDKAKKALTVYDRAVAMGDKADSYDGSPSGPGDVALMMAFVEATKPASGFRWTRTERDMIETSRGLIEGAQAKVEHGFSGTLFGPVGSEQRKLIAGIVKKAGEQATQARDGYLGQIKQINPDLAEILSQKLGSDFEPEK